MRDAYRPDNRLWTGCRGKSETLRPFCSSPIRCSRSTYTPASSGASSGMTPSCGGDERCDLVDRLIGRDPLRQRFVAEDQPMAKAVMHDRAHMIGRDKFVPIKPGAHAGAAIERKATAWAGPDLQPLA